jgi:hypothetical protein
MVLNVNDLDGRTRALRRVRALEREFIAALGGAPARHLMILVRSAAELTAIAEQTRAQLLAGDGNVTHTDMIRSENAMARAIRALAIPASPAQAKDFGAMMQRLATPPASPTPDPAEVADDPDERTGGEMLPAAGDA